MSSRIEVELTSQKSDGMWTWRAAGAKEPKGTVEGSLLYDGAKIGDVVRAEVTFEIDGIIVESIMAPKPKKTESNLLEITTKEPVAFLTRTVTNRDKNHRGGNRNDFKGKGRQRQSSNEGETEGSNRPKSRRGDRTTGTGRPSNRPQPTEAEKQGQATRIGQRPDKKKAPERAVTPRFKKLVPKNLHRAKALEAITLEHLPIAEQLLKGGIPAVRQALATQNEKAIAEGKPTVPESAILSIAEPMLPALNLATWKDRAEEAIKIAPEASLRDLRSVISAAELIKHDDETRGMLEKLKVLTQSRAEALSAEWLKEIQENLSAKRIIRAVRLSSRPPEPTAKLPAEVTEELTKAVNEMMSPDTPSDRWAALIDALSQSPIRRQVKPQGLPGNATPELLELAKENSGRIPALSQLLGIAIPPPPRPRKSIAPKKAPAAEAPAAEAPAAEAPAAEAPAAE